MAKTAKPKSLKATVTHLEMRTPPRITPPLPVNLHATLIRATDIPLHFYRYLQWQVGREWHWGNRLRMKDEELAGIVHAKTTRIYVLSVDGAPAGFFELSETTDAKVELVYLGLMNHVRTPWTWPMDAGSGTGHGLVHNACDGDGSNQHA
jgi:hypothetical protein